MRKLPLLLIISGVLLMVAALCFLPTQSVSAQCNNPSTCKSCHEIQGEKSVAAEGAWHQQHALFDFCAQCHNCDARATDPVMAHAGVINRLEDMAVYCKKCHTNDLAARYKVYTDIKGINDPAIIEKALKATPVPAAGKKAFSIEGFGVQQPTTQPTPRPTTPPKATPAAPTNATGNGILAALLIAGVFGGGGIIYWNERKLRQAQPDRPNLFARMWHYLTRESWSPYAAGILLGVVCILAVLTRHLLSASGPVATITSTVVNGVAPEAADQNLYFKFIFPPGINWQVMLLVGVFFGGMLGAVSSRTFKLRWNGDPTWNKVFGKQPWKRFVIGFLGAMIVQYGASIAGGCTSGLAISGGMLLAPSAFIFMAGMFASGILAALLVYRRRY